MNKKIMPLLLAALLVFAGCGKKENKTIDLPAFCAGVLEQVNFNDELITVSQQVAGDYYDLSFDGLEEYSISLSATSATASELSVFRCKDKDALAAAAERVQQRIQEQLANYENYRPDEVFRLQNALVLTEGNYLLFAVSDDNEAIQALFEQALK